jgi:four helix bundle protein
MAGVLRFEDLIAWQKARELTKAVYKMTAGPAFVRHVRLAGQIESAAVSVMSNVAEGFERDGLAEFHRFLTIAKASCGEVRSLLYVALDAELVNTDTFDRMMAQSEEVARVVGGLRASVDRSIKSRGNGSIREDDPLPYLLEPDDL